MKVVELLKINRESLKIMSDYDVKRDDWKYLDLFDQYNHLRSCKIKYREVIRILSCEYGISQSSVERVIRRLSRDC